MPDFIVVLGCASNVGKSWVSTGLCALARERGVSVAPFKARNLSNNAAPAADLSGGWGEIGRAQAAQAEAAGVAPHVDMNPILFKPGGTLGSQLIVHGHPVDHDGATLEALTSAAHSALRRLSAQHGLIVVEGAGSPVELNLMDRDLANVPMVRLAAAIAAETGGTVSVVLVGDIERGGIFASMVGTLALLPDDVRALVKGLVVNRLRGEARFFADGARLLEARCGVPVLGVLPWSTEINIDPEDDLDISVLEARPPAALDIAVVRLPGVANFEDLTSLGAVPGVALRMVDTAEDVAWPDLLVLPGARDPQEDLRWMQARGLNRAVCAAAARGVPVLGLCGGYQLLGQTLADPEGHTGAAGTTAGLGLLPVHTVYAADKSVRPTEGESTGAWLFPEGLSVSGYEIHHGQTSPGTTPLLRVDGGRPEGTVQGNVAGTYLHGLLNSQDARSALLTALRARRGLPPLPPVASAADQRAQGHTALARLLEAQLNLDGLLPPPDQMR